MVETLIVFLLRPSQLVVFRNEGKNDAGARPLTYFVLSCAITFGMFELLFLVQRKQGNLPIEGAANPFERLLVEGFAKGETSKILVAIMPFLAAVGLYAYGIHRAAKARKLTLSFRLSLSYACICAGSILLIYAVLIPFIVIPFMPMLSARAKLTRLPWWDYPLSVFGWGLLMWFIRCYLVLLKTTLGLQWGKTLSLWLEDCGVSICGIYFFSFGSCHLHLAYSTNDLYKVGASLHAQVCLRHSGSQGKLHEDARHAFRPHQAGRTKHQSRQYREAGSWTAGETGRFVQRNSLIRCGLS